LTLEFYTKKFQQQAEQSGNEVADFDDDFDDDFDEEEEPQAEILFNKDSIYLTIDKTFLPILEMLKGLTDSFTIFLDDINDPPTLRMKVMDPSHISLSDINLPLSYFKPYNLDVRLKSQIQKARYITLNAMDLYKFVRAKGKKDKKIQLLPNGDVTFFYNGKQVNEELEAPERYGKTKFGKLGDKDEYEMYPIPKIHYDSSVEVGSRLFYDTMKEMRKFTNFVTLISKPDSFIFSTTFDDPDEEECCGGYSKKLKYPIEYTDKNKSLIYCTKEEHKWFSRAVYPMFQLYPLSKPYKLCDTIKFSFSTEMPMRIDYNIDIEGVLMYSFITPHVGDNEETEEALIFDKQLRRVAKTFFGFFFHNGKKKEKKI